jgi:sugar phosphate isomerase/epimerase
VGAALKGARPGFRLWAAEPRFRYSVCNELFEKWKFDDVCRAIKKAGYAGVEIAPFTLADHVDEITPARRRELRDIMRSEGVEFAGLHWLLITPKWLHVSTADGQIREKSWQYFLKLIDLSSDLGKGIMVLGSPKQRGIQGNTKQQATENLKAGLASVAPHAAERGITVCLEPLASKDTEVVNTMDEAAAIVKSIGHPAIQMMFDFHNTPDEREPFDVLVRRHFKLIRHVHINEMNGGHLRKGGFDFLPVLQTLAKSGYRHWVSLEVFDFKPGPERILKESMDVLRNLEVRLKR